MKMKPADYELLEKEITAFLEKHPTLQEEYMQRGLSEKRFRWDILYKLSLSPYICTNLYGYLNDEHIDSALRKITGTK
jgi:hypothetical protein